jgi:hypothetical protein
MREHKPKVKRRPDQVSVGFFAKKDFVARLREHVQKTGTNRSEFIRRSIVEQMRKEGEDVPEELLEVLPPYTKHGNSKARRIGGTPSSAKCF